MLTLPQALLCTLWHYFCESCWNFNLGSQVVQAPLLSGAVIGLILGDMETGITVGAEIQIIYLGFTTVHPGAFPPSPYVVSMLSTVFVIAFGYEYAIAVVLTIAFTLLYQVKGSMTIVFLTAVSHLVVRAAKDGKTRKMLLLHLLPPQLFRLFFTAIPFVLLYCTPYDDIADTLYPILNYKVSLALEAGVRALFVLSAGRLLYSMGNKHTIPFFILGFLLVKYINFNYYYPPIVPLAFTISV
ncbi:PTS sugar transporter subunit IIC, partial [Eubacteriales bacterium OttesenSCG-928-N14]|nr:PTS sugar transporter subunit IIC [Eubacteriales bacterium OttesenSCG-928-N14]